MGNKLEERDRDIFRLVVKMSRERVPPCLVDAVATNPNFSFLSFCGTCCLDCEQLYDCYLAWKGKEKLRCILERGEKEKWCSATKRYLEKILGEEDEDNRGEDR